MAIKLDKLVTYYKKIQPIKSHNLFEHVVTWGHVIN